MKIKFLNKIGHLSLLLILMISFADVTAQSPNETKPVENIPFDPQVRYGKLPNGFTYYIRKNNSPANKVQMKLIVSVGSLHQDPDQIEVAHLLEHMGFNELDHFPEVSSLKKCVDKWGLKFGNEWNATTADESTEYYMILPADKPAVLNTAWLIMHDWAQGIRLSPESVDAERGVVLQEIKQGDDYNGRMSNQRAVKITGQPINPGSMADYSKRAAGVNNFKFEALVRFYKDWYRPDLQAAIIVGDINVEEVEKKIKETFSDLKMPENPRPAKDVSKVGMIRLTGRNNHIVITDPQMNNISMQVYWKYPSINDGFLRNRKDFRRDVMLKIFNALMAERILSSMQSGNQYSSPIYGNIRHDNRFFLGADALSAYVAANAPEEIIQGYQNTMKEIERVIRFGFTEAELCKAKTEILKTQELQKVVDNSEFVGEFASHFLHRAAAPSSEYRKELEKSLIAEITLQELNENFWKWVASKNRDVIFEAPEKYIADLPDKKTIQRWDAAIKKLTLEPYQIPAPIPTELLSAAEQPNVVGNVYTRSKDEETGILRIKLVSGIRVILKYIKKAPDSWPDYKTISIEGFRKGGTSAYWGDDLLMATYAGEIISHAGVGKFNKFELDQILQNKVSNFPIPSLSANSKVISTKVATEHAEAALQLIYLYFTSPRKDRVAFDDWKRLKLKALSTDSRTASNEFENMVNRASGSGSLEQNLNREMLEKIQFDRTYEIYNDNFSDPAGFTFVIAGDFDEEKITTLVVKYLGNIPSERNAKGWAGDEVNGSASKIYYGGNDDKAEVRLLMQNTYDGSDRNTILIDLLGKALEIRIFDRIREKESGSYTPRAGSGRLGDMYRFSIQFDCSPDRTEYLIAAVLDEIEKIRVGDFDAGMFERIMVLQRQQMEKAVQSQNSWINYMLQKYQEGKTVSAPPDERKEVLETIILEDLKEAAAKYFNPDNAQRFVWLPEKYKPSVK